MDEAVGGGTLPTQETNAAMPAGQYTRRSVLAMGLRRSVETLAVLGGIDLLVQSAEAAHFAANAPEYSHRNAFTKPIDYGNLQTEAEENHTQGTICFGDSVEYGWNHGSSYSPARIVAADMNVTLAATRMQPPHDRDGARHEYWGNVMLAQAGVTVAQVTQQIRDFEAYMRDYPGDTTPWTVEVSMGGNDALNFLTDHLRPDKAAHLIYDFEHDFLPQFRAQARVIVEGLVRLQQTPSLSHVRRIIVSGLPDIGRSSELWFMKGPIRGVATAACKYMNAALADVIDEVQATTELSIAAEDIFTDIDGKPIPISDIHPTQEGYRRIADKREARRRATFPDGTRSLRHERMLHGVHIQEPGPA